jgi:menaquinone-specific isochorismate synthase
VSLLTFLQCANGAERMYWENEPANVSFAGCGVAVQFVADGPERFKTIRKHIAELYAQARVSGPPIAAPRVFGGFSFSTAPTLDPSPSGGGGPDNSIWAAFPAAYFMLPHCQLTRANGQAWLTINRYVTDPDAEWGHLRDEHAALVEWLRVAEAAQTSAARILQVDYPVSRAGWRAQVEAVRSAIAQGQVDKVVMSRTADILLAADVDVLHALAVLQMEYARTYRFLIEPLPGHVFFGATPELLANLRDKQLTTGALAGSQSRGATPEADDQLAQELLDSAKNRHEHALVVDSLRDALIPVTSDLRIASNPTVVRYRNIQHLYTPIEATLHERANILDVVEHLHPTPALGGHPRHAALTQIEAHEIVPRGWYGAPVGWLDYRGNGMFVVAIRSAVSDHRRARLYAGAGIVGDSDPDKEWDETRIKFKPMFSALGGHDGSPQP